MTERNADRAARLKAALRDNLRKRKAQEREQDDPAPDPDAPRAGPSADGDSAPAER